MLFQRFDRLLFLQKGGQTVYYGEVGDNACVLTKYFERNGAHPCPPSANPAEWMLEVIGAAPGSRTEIDWYQTWRDSPEYKEVHRELDRLKTDRPNETAPATTSDDKASFREFAAPFGVQLWQVTKRVFAQYWRTPSYIYSKMCLCIGSGLFIGFSFFNAGTSQQELQNQMFAIFMLFTIFGQLVQQIMPHFVTQRALYEVRERPSKTYSWKAFMISNIVVELPWNSLMAVLIFLTWYYPIGLYHNASPTNSVTSRSGLMFLLIWQFLLFTSTFTNMVIAAIEDAETGGNIANLMFSLTLVFCGVLASPSVFPRFWIFMYRVSPFTYLVDAMLSVGVADNVVVCAANELRRFAPRAGQTCGAYMAAFIASSGGGTLVDAGATDQCAYCSISSTNQFLQAVNSHYALRWRNFGILWVFIVFNAFAAVFLYWLARVPKKTKTVKKEPETAKKEPETRAGEKAEEGSR
jgi:ATP-binding cassette subfamily G (WHITE) protein 2 (PDR)